MRPFISGFIGAALYTLALATLIAMALPTEARVEAYLDAAHRVEVTTEAVAPLVG